MLRQTISLYFVLILSYSLVSHADIRNVPDDYETIQDAVDHADFRDTILVAEGEYFENLSITTDALVIASTFIMNEDQESIDATIIDGDEEDVCIVLNEVADVQIIGFTITHGAGDRTGGLELTESSCHMANCRIVDNLGDVGVSLELSEGEFVECEFTGNRGNVYGALRVGSEASVTLRRCLIADNSGEDGVLVFFNSKDNLIENCTITNNECDNIGGIKIVFGSSVEMINSIVFDNTETQIELNFGAAVEMSYCDIEGGEDGVEAGDNDEVTWGDGNIDEDPLFAGVDDGDYYLTVDSPCIDSGDPNYPDDPDSTQADMGAYYYYHDDDNPPEILVEPLILDANEAGQYEIYIENIGDGILYWRTSYNAEWISCEPPRASARANDESFLFVTIEEVEDWRGILNSTLHVMSNDPENSDVEIEVIYRVGGGECPYWTEIPDSIEANAGDVVSFNLTGEDPDGFPVTISFDTASIQNHDVEFLSNDNGLGTFYWETTLSDSGVHTAKFMISDGVLETFGLVSIKLINDLSSPERRVNSPFQLNINNTYPNPFNSSTRLTYTVHKPGPVTLKLFDVAGREISVLKSGHHLAGRFEYTLDANALPSGIYLTILEAERTLIRRKIVLLK